MGPDEEGICHDCSEDPHLQCPFCLGPPVCGCPPGECPLDMKYDEV